MSLAAARPLISVYTDKAEAGGVTVCLPAVFRYKKDFRYKQHFSCQSISSLLPFSDLLIVLCFIV